MEEEKGDWGFSFNPGRREEGVGGGLDFLRLHAKKKQLEIKHLTHSFGGRKEEGNVRLAHRRGGEGKKQESAAFPSYKKGKKKERRLSNSMRAKEKGWRDSSLPWKVGRKGKKEKWRAKWFDLSHRRQKKGGKSTFLLLLGQKEERGGREREREPKFLLL